MNPGTAVGGPGDDAGRFIKPRAIDTDGEHLFVIDRSGRVQVLNAPDGRCLAYWRLPEWSLGYPTGVTIGPSPRGDGTKAVWIADTHYHRVLVYGLPVLSDSPKMLGTQTPELLLQFGKYGYEGGDFIYPSDVLPVAGADGKSVARVYVSEFGGNDRISVFEVVSVGTGGSLTAKFVSSFGRPGEAEDPEAFQRPQSLVWRAGKGGRGDEILISDSINHRIGRFSPDGKLIGWLNGGGVPGKGPGQFSHPRGLLLLADGSLLVVEFGNNRVQHIDIETGACLGLFGMAGRSVGELAEPWAVAGVGREGFIADAMNHRVVRMRLPEKAALSGAASDIFLGTTRLPSHTSEANLP